MAIIINQVVAIKYVYRYVRDDIIIFISIYSQVKGLFARNQIYLNDELCKALISDEDDRTLWKMDKRDL